MTEQLEHYLRETFAADAEQAPAVHDLAGAARRQVHRQRRRRTAVTGAGLGVLGLVAGVVVTFGGGTPSSLPANDPTTTTAPADPEPVLSYRGVHVPVPAEMLAEQSRVCGTAVKDAAYVIDTEGVTLACSATPAHPERLTEVVMQPWELPPAFDAPPTGTRVLDDGRTQMVTRIPDRQLRLIVTSPDPDRASRLIDGVQVVNDPDGCAVRDPRGRVAPVADAPGPIVPPGASSGSVCGYREGWLSQSHTLDGDDAAKLADALNSAPEGLSEPGPNSCGLGGLGGPWLQEPRWQVQLVSGDKHSDMTIFGGNCSPGGAVNDSGRAARLTSPLVTLLNSFASGPELLHGVVSEK